MKKRDWYTVIGIFVIFIFGCILILYKTTNDKKSIDNRQDSIVSKFINQDFDSITVNGKTHKVFWYKNTILQYILLEDQNKNNDTVILIKHFLNKNNDTDLLYQYNYSIRNTNTPELTQSNRKKLINKILKY